MFLHLGGDTVIRSKDVIAILNYDGNESSTYTEDFLAQAVTEYVSHINDEATKAIVITNDKVYYSPISSMTLMRRSLTEIEALQDDEPSEGSTNT
ncbi:hypothetical protein DH09_09265 [Bacillaceae bacterium JMAK1]|nr:hypothetical protein DH09_09265 [Bacillaceae bacterium JMAK1]